MKEEVFYKHVRETTFTKDYTLCGKVIKHQVDDGFGSSIPTYELHIGVYVFPVDHQFVKKTGIIKSLLEATSDPLLKIKLEDHHSLHTFLDFSKTLTPSKAVKKKVYMDYVIE